MAGIGVKQCRFAVIVRCRPQYEYASRVGKSGTVDDVACVLETLRTFLIRGEKHINGCAIDDVRIEPSGGPCYDANLGAGRAIVTVRQLLCRTLEIACYGNVDWLRSLRNWQCQQQQQPTESHGRPLTGRKLGFLLAAELVQERFGIAIGLFAALEHQCTGSLESDA